MHFNVKGEMMSDGFQEAFGKVGSLLGKNRRRPALGRSLLVGGALDSLILTLILFTLFLAYIFPVIVYPMPTGTDVYTHMFYTAEMKNSDSLSDFYGTCTRNGYIGCDYPFGLWLFGSLISKITGIGIFELSYILPLIMLCITILLFYVYSGVFLKKRQLCLISVLFLIGMPNIAITVLGYTPSIFSIPILLSILYFTFNDEIKFYKKTILISLLVFSLLIMHTGTYIFLLSFAMTYLIFSAVLWGKFERDVFLVLISLLILYTIVMWIFPEIQPQYLDKTKLFISVGQFFSERLNLPFMDYLSRLFYDRVFVQSQAVDAILWGALFYTIIEFITFIRLEIAKFKPQKYVPALGIFGGITNISHSIMATPIWIGPLHTIFGIFGLLRLDRRSICILLSCILVLLIPGGLYEGSTGALREIFYFLIIIPIVSALGFELFMEKIVYKWKSSLNRKVVAFLFLAISLNSLIVLPIIGNMYYRLDITGTNYERASMEWLGTQNDDGGVSGYGYRHMITIYSGKSVPEATTVTSGTETRRILNDLRSVYFGEDSEKEVEDLYAHFNVKYLLSSTQVSRNLGFEIGNSTIDTNTELDKIYSTKDNLGIYSYRQNTVNGESSKITPQEINYVENGPIIEDSGMKYNIQTKYYTVEMSRLVPTIDYLGNENENYLGEGFISDSVSLYWFGGEYNGMEKYVTLSELNYTCSSLGNQIIYNALIREDNNNWATIIVKYTFYERAFQKDVIIANDRAELNQDSQFRVIHTYTQFSPMLLFTYYDEREIPVAKKIYPSEDNVKISNVLNGIYLNNGKMGFYVDYGETAPKPDEIVYKGSTLYNYSSVNIYTRNFIDAGDSLHVSELISVGDDKLAESNAKMYKRFSILPYPDGKIPLSIVGFIDSSSDSDKMRENIYRLSKMKQAAMTDYTIGLSMKDTNLSAIKEILSFKNYIMGYEKMYEAYSRYYYGEDTQKNNILAIERDSATYKEVNDPNFTIDGFIADALNYNLVTIKLLKETNLKFIIGTAVNPPYMDFYSSGIRYPKFAYHNGTETGIVIIPVSGPTSNALNSYTDTEKIFTSWKSTIDACSENDEMCMFLWNPDKIGDADYTEKLLKIVKYGLDSGLTSMKPMTIDNHIRLLRNVSIEVEMGIDTARLTVRNRNNVAVNGIGMRISLPHIENECPFKSDAKIVRIRDSPDSCNIYFETDINPNGTEMINVEPNTTKEAFKIDIENDIEGESRMRITDSSDMPIENVNIIISGRMLETGTDGRVLIDFKRGIYDFIAEKPGYITQNSRIIIKGKVYSISSASPETYVMSIVVLALLVVVYISRRIVYHKTVHHTRKGVDKVRSLKKKLMKVAEI